MEIHLPEIVGSGYGEFWRCRKRYRVVKGGKGSKKSATAALWYICHLMQYPQANLLVVRQVGRTHLDSTFAQLRWAIRRLGAEAFWEATRQPLELRYRPTGQRVLFRGFDSAEKLASTTVETGYLCWVWIEEAFELTSEEAFEKLDLSVPRGQVPAPLFKQTTLTFNPWSKYHWLKKRFFDRPDPDVFTMTATYQCNEFLDEADRRRYEAMRRDNPRRYAVAGLGEWGVAEGLVFDRWRVEEFDVRQLPQPERWRHIFGLDYGYASDPTAFIAAAVNPAERLLYIYDEHYGRRMLNRDIADMLIRKGYGKERIRADSAEPKSNDDLRRLGIRRIVPAAKGQDSVRNGIARLQEYTMVVHPVCPHTAAELAAYTWETDGTGSGRCRPVDRDNHLMDALRYAMEDAVFFRPGVARQGQPVPAGIRPGDVQGGWNG